MRQLTSEGQKIVHDLAQKFGFSPDAVTHMMLAMVNGNGSMAQFNHPEFGGSGQWMQGGMLMLGDMFNSFLKGRVDALCYDIGNLLANQPGLFKSGSFQSQSQSGHGQQSQTAGASTGLSSLFVPDPEDNWWPKDLGAPTATGSQNNARYAYFSHARRLAVKSNNEVWLYDALDHQIGGFSQQQGGGGSFLFTSQYGEVCLAHLPVISIDGRLQPVPPPQTAQERPSQTPPLSSVHGPEEPEPSAQENDIIADIERLGALHAKAILTDDEFSKKKAELLARL